MTRIDKPTAVSTRRKVVVALLLAVAAALVFSSIALAQAKAPSGAPSASFYAGKAASSKKLSPVAMLWAMRVLASLMLIGGIFTIGSRNPVVAALCLVGTLFCTGVLFLLLHATFIAAIQVLVYAGAIMVLFVFVVMSVGHPEREEIGLSRGIISKLVGIGAALLLLFRVSPIYMGFQRTVSAAGDIVAKPLPPVSNSYGDVEHVGKLLFSDYLFPFEAISILLLVAIVGAVMVTRQRRRLEDEAAAATAGASAAASGEGP